MAMKLMVVLITLAILQLSFLAKASDSRLFIKIDENVEVHNQKKLSLYDIVELENVSKAQIEEFKSITLEEQFLQDQFQISSASLIREHRQLFRGAQLNLPNTIKIKKVNGKNSSALSKKQIQRDLFNHLRLQCSDCQLTLSVLTLPAFQMIDESEVRIDFADINLKSNFLSQIIVSDRHGIRSFWLSGQVKIERPTLVLNKNLNAGSRIKDEDLHTVVKDISSSMFALKDKNKIVDSVLQRTLSQGSAIQSNDLKVEFAVQRGQTVKLISTTAEFELSIQAIAEQNGAVGDNIKLKNTNTKKDLLGVVKEKGVVELQ